MSSPTTPDQEYALCCQIRLSGDSEWLPVVAAQWAMLVAEATTLGYTVELVDYCESSLSPGLLGQALGVCIYASRLIRVREALRPADRCFVLRHELDHAHNADRPKVWHRELDARHHREHAPQLEAINQWLWPNPDTPEED